MLTPASVLLARDYGDRRLHGRHAPQHLFTRDGGEYEWTGSMFVPRIINQPIYEPVKLANGLERVALLIHPATEQEVQAPFNFADAAWSLPASFTRANAVSCIQGETASRITTDGTVPSASFSDGFGNWNGSPQTATWTVELVHSTIVSLGMRDTSGGGSWVYIVNFNLGTGAVSGASGSGTAAVRLLRERGPNGGMLWRVSLTANGTSGNGRAMHFYPVSTGAAGFVVLHEMGWEEKPHASNPLPGPANTPKVANELAYQNPPDPGHRVEYWHWTDRMEGLGGAARWVMEIRNSGAPRGGLYYSSGNLAADLYNGTGTATSSLAAVPVYGSENEAIVVRGPVGWMRLLHRRSPGVIVDGGASSTPSGGLPTAWDPGAVLALAHANGSSADRGSIAFHRWAIFDAAACDTATDFGAPHELYAEVRRAVDAIPADGRLAA